MEFGGDDFTKKVYRLDVVDSGEQRTRFISGSGSIRNARVDRFPIGFPPLPLDSSRCTWVTCIEYGCMCHFKSSPPPPNGFHSILRLPRYTVFVKLCLGPRYYFGRELLRGRPIDGGRRTREAFNNGEEYRNFIVLCVRVVTMLIYNFTIRIV